MSDLPTPTADGARVLAGASGPQETTETPFRFAIAGDQGDVQSAKLANGRILLVWTEAGNIMRQTFEANGTPEGSPAAIASTGDAESQPAVSVLADGRVVVIWTVLSGGNYDVMAQTFTVSGPPGPPTVTAGPLLTVADDVAPAASAAPAPDVAALADGGFAPRSRTAASR
jgi:hypothetical protein